MCDLLPSFSNATFTTKDAKFTKKTIFHHRGTEFAEKQFEMRISKFEMFMLRALSVSVVSKLFIRTLRVLRVLRGAKLFSELRGLRASA